MSSMCPSPGHLQGLLSVLCLKHLCLNPPGNRMFVGGFYELGWELWFLSFRRSRVLHIFRVLGHFLGLPLGGGFPWDSNDKRDDIG